MEEAEVGRTDQGQPGGNNAESGADGGAGGMGDWLAEHERAVRSLRRGDVVEGVVVSADREEMLVDIGTKSEAVVPGGEQSLGPGTERPKLGDTVLAYVMSNDDGEGRPLLSLTRALAERGWRDLQKVHEDGTSIEGEAVEHNKGGLVVNVLGVRGFVPLSQIADLRRSGPDDPIEARLQAMIGRTLLLKVIEMNRRRNRLILSERAALQERRAREKDRLLSELQPGETRHGVVSSVCDFGAFVDLGGADGLVHLSELSWGQVAHPSQVVKVGQELDVYVVGVDRENKKIALSLKRLQGEPWEQIGEKYELGQTVSGRITKLAAFGAFAEIEPGIEGLVHISELADERITHPKQVVREGDVLPLKIIRIEAARHRLGLSLRQVDDAAFDYEGGSYTAEAEPEGNGAEPVPYIGGGLEPTGQDAPVAEPAEVDRAEADGADRVDRSDANGVDANGVDAELVEEESAPRTATAVER